MKWRKTLFEWIQINEMKAITGASKGRLTKREERINSHEQRNNDSGLKNELEWIMTMNDFKTRNANA